MVLTKILKRKDASSLVVAIIAASAIGQMITSFTSLPTALLTGLGNNPEVVDPAGAAWQISYFYPVVALALQLVALELLARGVIALRAVYRTS